MINLLGNQRWLEDERFIWNVNCQATEFANIRKINKKNCRDSVARKNLDSVQQGMALLNWQITQNREICSTIVTSSRLSCIFLNLAQVQVSRLQLGFGGARDNV